MFLQNMNLSENNPTLKQTNCNLNCFHSLQWYHNEHSGISNHQPHDCLLNCLFMCMSNKTSNFHVTGLCAGNSPVTGEFPAQIASNVENVSIWWHHHVGYHQGSAVTAFSVSCDNKASWQHSLPVSMHGNQATTMMMLFSLCQLAKGSFCVCVQPMRDNVTM